jgi:hypothetical protein
MPVISPRKTGMGDIALSIGGIGAVIPGNAVAMQVNPAGPQAGVPAQAASAAAAPAASVVVNLSDAAWRALALDAATVGAAASISSKTLEELVAAALLALLLSDRQEDTPAAAAIRMYLLIQALNEL